MIMVKTVRKICQRSCLASVYQSCKSKPSLAAKLAPFMALSLVCAYFCLALATSSSVMANEGASIMARKGNAQLIRKENIKAINSLTQALYAKGLPIYTRASILNDRALAYGRMKNYELALNDFNKAIELFPEYAIAYNNRGLLLHQMGFYSEAIKDFNRAIALQPTQGATFHNRANAYLKTGAERPAFKDYGQAITLLNDKTAPHLARGQIHLSHHRHFAALRELNQALSQNKKHADVLYNRGQVNLSLERKKEAIADISNAVDLSPQNLAYKMTLARIYLDNGQLQNARWVLSKLLDNDPLNAEVMIMRGRIYGALGSYITSLDDLDQAVSLSNSAEAYAERALVRVRNNMLDLAAEDMDSAIQRAPKTARSWAALGQAAQMSELIGNAERYFLEAIKRDKNDKDAIRGLVELGLRDPADQAALPFDEDADDWTIIKHNKNQYIARHPQYSKLKVHLDLYGPGVPKILEWTVLNGKYKGFGLLRYYAGSKDKNQSFEQVSIINIKKQKVLSIEPYRWGKQIAQWKWGDYDLIVKDPDGIENKIALNKPPARHRPKLTSDGDWLWGNSAFGTNKPKRVSKKYRKKKKVRVRKKKKKFLGIFGF